MKYKVRLNGCKITSKQLIADLRSVSTTAKTKVLSQKKYEKYGKYSTATYQRRFGSWISALHVARLYSVYQAAPSHAELFNNLKRVWRKVKRQPTYEIMRTSVSAYPAHIYCRVFGRWTKALRMFDLYQRDKSKYEKAAMKLSRGKRVTKGIGTALRYEILRRDSYRCKLCGRSPANERGVLLTIDHIKPLSRGGKTIASNLRTLCMECNLGKAAT